MNRSIFRLSAVFAFLSLWLTAAPPATFALGSTISVVPGQVTSGTPAVITVTGTDFVDGSTVVLLENIGALSTTFVNTTVLTAAVPASVPVGIYDVIVSTGTETATCADCLAVVSPAEPLPFARPQFAVYTSKLSGSVKINNEVTLKVVMENVGKATAYNVQATFSSTDLVPTKTGGVVILGKVDYDQEVDVLQTFIVSAPIIGQGLIVADMTVTYYDAQGASYSDKFTLSIPVSGGAVSGGGGSVAPTATPTGVKSSQLVITGYSSNVEPLQPGEQFALNLTVQNVGNASAQRITMIVGGGSSGGGGGTPSPGGVSGGGGDFSNFAPVGSSNVQSLGDLKAGEKIQALQNLVVNVSTNPGAYPLRVTFSYLNDKNEVISDEQVITLLVYSLPNVDVSFYRPLDPFYAGQAGVLPIQVVNLGRRFSVLGNIKIETQNGSVENGTGLIGSLDAGGYFTLDALFTPDQPGTVTLDVVIDYLDDFNQPRVITKKLEIEVQEGFIEEPAVDPSLDGDGGQVFVEEETTLHKIFRFIKGLFGLDSAWPVWQPAGGGGMDMPPVEPVPALPVPGKG
jgi:hypothetical protein